MSQINLTELKEFIPELLALYTNKVEHADAYSAAIDAAAKASKA